jgi:hypothetical protein
LVLPIGVIVLDQTPKACLVKKHYAGRRDGFQTLRLQLSEGACDHLPHRTDRVGEPLLR